MITTRNYLTALSIAIFFGFTLESTSHASASSHDNDKLLEPAIADVLYDSALQSLRNDDENGLLTLISGRNLDVDMHPDKQDCLVKMACDMLAPKCLNILHKHSRTVKNTALVVGRSCTRICDIEDKIANIVNSHLKAPDETDHGSEGEAAIYADYLLNEVEKLIIHNQVCDGSSCEKLRTRACQLNKLIEELTPKQNLRKKKGSLRGSLRWSQTKCDSLSGSWGRGSKRKPSKGEAHIDYSEFDGSLREQKNEYFKSDFPEHKNIKLRTRKGLKEINFDEQAV